MQLGEADSRVPFPTTSWSLLLDAQQASATDRARLLRIVLRRYWKPVYAFFRSKGQSPEDSEDLVQGFLTRFTIDESVLMAATPGRRFRSLIRVCARNFLIDETRKNKAQRRTPKDGLVSFEVLQREDGAPYEPADVDSTDAFDDVWRRELLGRAMATVEKECRLKGREADWRLFLSYFIPADGNPCTWAELAAEHGLNDWQVAARKAHWVRARFATAIREQVAIYVDSDDEIDVEIASLMS